MSHLLQGKAATSRLTLPLTIAYTALVWLAMVSLGITEWHEAALVWLAAILLRLLTIGKHYFLSIASLSLLVLDALHVAFRHVFQPVRGHLRAGVLRFSAHFTPIIPRPQGTGHCLLRLYHVRRDVRLFHTGTLLSSFLVVRNALQANEPGFPVIFRQPAGHPYPLLVHLGLLGSYGQYHGTAILFPADSRFRPTSPIHITFPMAIGYHGNDGYTGRSVHHLLPPHQLCRQIRTRLLNETFTFLFFVTVVSWPCNQDSTKS